MQVSPKSLPSLSQVSAKRRPAGLLALIGLAALGLAAAPAHAQTTLSFDNFTAAAQANGGVAGVPSPYSTQGFTLTSPDGFVAYDGSSFFGDGETSLYDYGEGTTLTQDSGQAFSLNAIDLGPAYGNSYGTKFDGPVLFTGTRADGTTVTATETMTSATFQTFTFSGFTDLSSLTFMGNYNSGSGSLVQFDNIVLTPADAPSAAPEPSQVAALGFTAFGVLALILRARKRKMGTLAA